MGYIGNQYDINMLKIRIKEMRILKGETQQSLADKIGVKRQAVISWEKKKESAIPSLQNLVDLCETLDCSVDYLLGSVDTPEIAPISKASHYSGISTEIIRYGIENPDYLDCLNFFMHPDNCAKLFNNITLSAWKKYWIDSSLAEIKQPLKDEIINVFDKYISITPIYEVNKDSYKSFLAQEFPKEHLIIFSEKKENGIKIKSCIKPLVYQNFYNNDDFNYNTFIKYLVEYTFESLTHNALIEMKKVKLSNEFIKLFTKYLEESESGRG